MSRQQKKLVEQLSVYRAEATSLEKLFAFQCMEEINIKDDHTFVSSLVPPPPHTISLPLTFTFLICAILSHLFYVASISTLIGQSRFYRIFPFYVV
jgi:hypothetical protein